MTSPRNPRHRLARHGGRPARDDRALRKTTFLRKSMVAEGWRRARRRPSCSTRAARSRPTAGSDHATCGRAAARSARASARHQLPLVHARTGDSSWMIEVAARSIGAMRPTPCAATERWSGAAPPHSVAPEFGTSMSRQFHLSSRRRVLLSLAALALSACAQMTPTGDPLPSWKDGAAKDAVVQFVRNTTVAGSAAVRAAGRAHRHLRPGRHALGRAAALRAGGIRARAGEGRRARTARTRQRGAVQDGSQR